MGKQLKEWMPENPNPPADNIYDTVSAYNDGLHDGYDEGSIAGAKAVLNYILEHPKEFDDSVVSTHNAIQMLKELEEYHG